MDTQVRLESDKSKTSLELVEANTQADKPLSPTKKAYGEYGWVKLTDKVYCSLVSELGQNEVDRCIAYVDECAELTQNKNKWKNWAIVIRRCSRAGWGKTQGQQNRQKLKTDADYAGGDFLSE